jgi:hypothetical protein
MPTINNNHLAKMPILDERRTIVKLEAVSEYLKMLIPASPISPLVFPDVSKVRKLIDKNNQICLLLVEYGLDYESLRNSLRGMPRSSSPIVTTNFVPQIWEPKMYCSITTNKHTFPTVPRTQNVSPLATTSPAKASTGGVSISSGWMSAGFSARHGSDCSSRISILNTHIMVQ